MPRTAYTIKCRECGRKRVCRQTPIQVFCSRECRYAGTRKDTWDTAGRYLQKGYVMLRRNIGGKYQHKFLHVWVWERKHGPKPRGPVVHHKNENKQDNRLCNLKLMSRSQHGSLHHPKGRQFGKVHG